MKKQIALYFSWITAFYLYLYAMSIYLPWLKHAYYRDIPRISWFWGNSVAWMAAGGLVCLLVYLSGKFELTRKIAALEFLMVGGFAFYMAAGILLYFNPISIKFPFLIRPFMIIDETSMILGSILFGYELILFVIRMIRLKKRKRITETPEEIKTAETK